MTSNSQYRQKKMCPVEKKSSVKRSVRMLYEAMPKEAQNVEEKRLKVAALEQRVSELELKFKSALRRLTKEQLVEMVFELVAEVGDARVDMEGLERRLSRSLEVSEELWRDNYNRRKSHKIRQEKSVESRPSSIARQIVYDWWKTGEIDADTPAIDVSKKLQLEGKTAADSTVRRWMRKLRATSNK